MQSSGQSIEKKGKISAPGRLCLFGEHQDYLGLPVIPMAINRRLQLQYSFFYPTKKDNLTYLTKLGPEENLTLIRKPVFTGGHSDYLKAVISFYWDQLQHLLLSSSISSQIQITSDIPIGSGVSSSAALLVNLVYYMANIILKSKITTSQIAEVAYECERNILGVACGKMDQYACSLGGLFHMTTSDTFPQITALTLPEDVYFVVGSSGIERQADIPLKKVQHDIFKALSELGMPKITDLKETDIGKHNMPQKLKKRLQGVIGVRDNTIEALTELKKQKIDLECLGKLLSDQHAFLRDNYQVSHPKLDVMCLKAIQNGAWGAKLTGAGFGGCMFALANKENVNSISNVLKSFGSIFIAKIDSGVTEGSNKY